MRHKAKVELSRIRKSEAIPSDTREMLMGEAYFLRAFFYHNLLRVHGGVPYLTGAFELSGDLEQYQLPRNTFKETVDFIVADLDSAITRLPVDARRGGTATRGAALALESRVWLHAASDLFAADKSPFDMEEVKYTSGTQQERWRKAKEAAQAVIDLGKYHLPQANTPGEYHRALLREDNPEFIWARYFSEGGGEAHNQSLWLSPNGYNGWTGDAPTQQHVNAYEMADGSEFEWEGADPTSTDEPVDADNPYDDRDPRFKANVLHNGADWRSRPSGLANLDPKGVIQTGWYEVPDREELRPGLDTREGPAQQWNGTKTGYNLRKFVSPNVLPKAGQAYNPWPFIRYAEILLNYAEASAELGETEDALWALNKVRSRVGMPDVPASGGPDRTLIERIRQEREVELAFEEFRYFDVRRWMIAPEVYSEGAKGIRIEGRRVDESHPDARQLTEYYYDYDYRVIQVDERRWQNKNYFVPITRDEMERNPNLVQNPGY